VLCQRVIDGRRVGRDVGSGWWVLRHHATSCDITRSGAGGVRRHSSEGVAEEGRGGGSGSGRRQAGVGSGSGRRVGIGSVRGSPYMVVVCQREKTCYCLKNSGWSKLFPHLETGPCLSVHAGLEASLTLNSQALPLPPSFPSPTEVALPSLPYNCPLSHPPRKIT